MKLLLFTRFSPAVGGLETVMETLASEWVVAGHEVQVATDIPAPAERRFFPFTVHHRPGTTRLLSLVKWCEAYVQGCIGLKTLWPLWVHRRLYVATHHTWYRRSDGNLGWQNHLKRWVSRHAVNIAPSRALAAELPAPCTVIPNPYRAEVFKQRPDSVRDRELIFVGRLVSDKGADLLLQSLAALASEDLRPSLTVVGEGPERPALERQATELGLAGQVEFTGSRSPEEVAASLNRHRILVVPSLWREPFGVVALEAIACGCLVVGSEGGGLPDAIGPCGLTFPNSDVTALAERLKTLLRPALDTFIHPEERAQHLARHQPGKIAKDYIDAMLAAASR